MNPGRGLMATVKQVVAAGHIRLSVVHGRTYVNALDLVTGMFTYPTMPFAESIRVRHGSKSYTLDFVRQVGDIDSSVYRVLVIDDTGQPVNLASNYALCYIDVLYEQNGRTGIAQWDPEHYRLNVGACDNVKSYVTRESQKTCVSMVELAEAEDANYVPVLRYGDTYYTLVSSLVSRCPRTVPVEDITTIGGILPIALRSDTLKIERCFYNSRRDIWPESVVELGISDMWWERSWPDNTIDLFEVRKDPRMYGGPTSKRTCLAPGPTLSLAMAMTQLADLAKLLGSVNVPLRK